MNELGKRIKQNYEGPARHLLVRRTPVVVRVDGRSFHTFTQRFDKPFDQRMIDAMCVSAIQLAGEMQGFKLGYVQSDEASFVLTDYDNLQTEPWFGYVKSKIESISAAKMTFCFARCMRLANINEEALFDARAFNIPENEVVNYFLWRATCTRCCTQKNHNWSTDLMDEEKNGIFILPDGSTRSDIKPHFEEINAIWTTSLMTSQDMSNEQAENESDLE